MASALTVRNPCLTSIVRNRDMDSSVRDLFLSLEWAGRSFAFSIPRYLSAGPVGWVAQTPSFRNLGTNRCLSFVSIFSRIPERVERLSTASAPVVWAIGEGCQFSNTCLLDHISFLSPSSHSPSVCLPGGTHWPAQHITASQCSALLSLSRASAAARTPCSSAVPEPRHHVQIFPSKTSESLSKLL